MNKTQVDDAAANFKILYRFTDEYYQMYKEDIDKTNQFYDYYKDIYGDIEQIKHLNQETNEGNKVFMDIPYEPIQKLKRLATESCVSDKDNYLLNLSELGKKLIYPKYELSYLNYEKDIHFYKTMDGFYTIEEENAFIPKNRNIPFWFSSPLLSYMVISARNGGMTAYKIKKPINILIIDCDNIKKIIEIVEKNEPPKIYFRGNSFDKKYALDLLRLSSCSEKGFIDQLSIYNDFNGYGDDIWLTKNPLSGPGIRCNLNVKNDDYFGIIKQKGKHNYNFAYLLSHMNNKYFNKLYDGYVIIEKYTPFFYNGITLEEFVFFDPYDKLQRDIEDQYDWYNYSKYFDFRIPHNFRLPRLYSEYNKNFDLYRYYNQQNYSKKNNILKDKARNHVSIIYLDVNNFKSINVNDKADAVKKELIYFIKFMEPTLCMLINAQNVDIVGYDKEIDSSNKQITLYYKPSFKEKLDELRIIFINLKQASPYPYKRPFFKEFEKIAEVNYINNIKQLDTLLNFKPKIIFGKFDLTYNSPEFKYLNDNGYNSYNFKTSIFPTNKDYVFINTNKISNPIISVDTLNYNMSYFLPIHVIL